MNRWEKEVMESWLRDEKTALKAVEGHYTTALAEIKAKILIMQGQEGEMAQSQIYQLQYQKSLQAQITAILEKLHSNEYQTIQSFLEGCYTSGFVGTMYSVAGQGIPMLLPIDPAAVVRAVITESKLSEELYESLGVDILNLKRTIRSEISRGIAANLPTDEIVRNIQMQTGVPLSRAKTIVRTESHRIQESAADDARQAVKRKGCDVVKQWDSTMDSSTRPTHQQLDGQSRETDEPFELGGKTAMYPGDFGDPAEDCNCRCVALTRARAAMGERELETLRKRAEFFGLDKSESFSDFRKRYQKTLEKIGKDGIIDARTGVVQKAITSGLVSKVINANKQSRHIQGSSGYVAGRSYIYGSTEDAQAIVDEFGGTGVPILDENGNWTHRERVEADKPIGVHVDQKTKEETETSSAMIVYSKTGSHVYPRKDGNE